MQVKVSLEANILFCTFATETINSLIMVRQKRYQYWGKNGIEWSDWFNYDGQEEPIQLKGFRGHELKNEYRTIDK